LFLWGVLQGQTRCPLHPADERLASGQVIPEALDFLLEIGEDPASGSTAGLGIAGGNEGL
jgi:hypothetical protein